jgi:hypothetical protein
LGLGLSLNIGEEGKEGMKYEMDRWLGLEVAEIWKFEIEEF